MQLVDGLIIKVKFFTILTKGERVYPLPVFDAVLTDMNTEEGI